MTLKNYLKEINLDSNLAKLISDLEGVLIHISQEIESASLQNKMGKTDNINVQNEYQSNLDIETNRIFLDKFRNHNSVYALISEEEELPVKNEFKDGQYNIFFDPLDGSSNVDANITVGTIFSIFLANHADDILSKGREQKVAGFVTYGASCHLVIAFADCGVQQFTLNRQLQEFQLTKKNILIPEETENFAINMSHYHAWDGSVRSYIDDCLKGKIGPRHKKFNMRWVGSLVADINRILNHGGVYLYPLNQENISQNGRLRLMYEINPMAFIVKAAGGEATDFQQDILELIPQNIHERVPIAIGSKNEVNKIMTYRMEKCNV